MTTLQILIVAAHAVGLLAGWYLHGKHVGIDSTTLGHVRDWLSQHNRKALANVLSGVLDVEAKR